jgi:hypothetical protein
MMSPFLHRRKLAATTAAWLSLLIFVAAWFSGCALERPQPARFTPPAIPQSPTSPPPTETVTPPPAATPTPEIVVSAPDAPGSERLVRIEPSGVDVIWWASQDNARNHIGDSFLYSGFSEASAFVSAVRFDVSRIARGAPLAGGVLQMVGLRDNRLAPAAGGSWTAQLVAQSALPDFRTADYQQIANAPAGVTLLPTLFPADLAAGKMNEWQLDPAALRWIEEQILNGATEVWVRINGPTGGDDTLFAWDSGFGPESRGAKPQLQLVVNEVRDTPQPLPTEPIVVGTQPAVPENVFTAAANALTATLAASEGVTPTPPYRFLTATPVAQNIATAQVIARLQNLPPIAAVTPPPANEATATVEAAYATAVAVSTGTYTPTPENAVTPFIVVPTPIPDNVATAAAQMLTAVARDRTAGTATPLPYNAVLATLTPTAAVVASTPRPGNAATAQAMVAYATAVAITTGTFTPAPERMITPTFTPQPTPIPLIIYSAALPPTPTPIPDAVPRSLAGKILFLSDRPQPPGLSFGNVWAYDLARGEIAYVTQPWVFNRAETADRRTQTEFGVLSLSVESDAESNFQIFLNNQGAGQRNQLTQFNADSYDPAWRPDGNIFAFVSQEAGNDEIYTMGRDGKNIQRLTTNQWEWDKHPSYSPDGSQIVFTSNRGSGRRQLWIMNADGSNVRQLFSSPFEDYSPVWVK